jgi:adenylate cyclase
LDAAGAEGGMPLNERTKLRLRTVAIVVLVSAAGGAIYGFLRGDLRVGGIVQGLAIGVMIGGPLSAFEILYWFADRGERLRRAPFLVSAAAKSLVYMIVIVAGLAAGIALFQSPGVLGGAAFGPEFGWGIAFSFAFGFAIQVGLHINRIVGGHTLLKFVAGRYNRPVEEDRVFLFLDMAESTATAEKIGDLRFMSLLNRFFYDVAGAVIETKGEIHKYVGDEVIVSWPLAAGVADANCVRCCFAIRDRVASNRARYLHEFGVVPAFRAGLHAGSVVTGEMGDYKQEIAHLGNVMNTTARILEACRSYGRPFLASGDAVALLALPPDIAVERLGSITLRGKQRETDLVAIERAAAAG